MLSRRHALGFALVTAETVLQGIGRAEPAAAAAEPKTTFARLTVASAAGPSALEGRIVAEGQAKEMMDRPEIRKAYLGLDTH